MNPLLLALLFVLAFAAASILISNALIKGNERHDERTQKPEEEHKRTVEEKIEKEIKKRLAEEKSQTGKPNNEKDIKKFGYCSNCGKKLPYFDDAEFCMYCGAKAEFFDSAEKIVLETGRCPVCGNHTEDSDSICSQCGFPVISIAGNLNQTETDRIIEAVKEYRKNLI